MILQTKQQSDQQDALLLIAGKKAGKVTGLSETVAEEWSRFTLQEEPLRTLTLHGKHYVFINEQKTGEEYRVAGHKARVFLPKTVATVCIHGTKHESLLVAEGLLLSNYQFIHYRRDAEKERYALQQIDFTAKIHDDAINELQSVIKAVSWARDLVNEPVSFLTATALAKAIEAKGEEAGFQVTILEKLKIEALKMGGLLAVNKGSVEPPTFTIIEYKPKKAFNKKPIVLVGKGVVYDTGGLSLKPTPGSMDQMKCDMAGAAMMAGTIYAAAIRGNINTGEINRCCRLANVHHINFG